MGTSSSESCTGHKCNCFRLDNNVKKVHIERDLATHWIWTSDHESTLSNSLSNSPYSSPEEIISIIRDYAYCPQNAYHVRKKIVCCEKNYLNHHRLLQKSLCKKWYSAQIALLSSFSIVLFRLDRMNAAQSNKFIQAFKDHSLPSLRPSYDSYPSYASSSSSHSYETSDCMYSTRKTINIDGCSVRMHLKSFDHERNNTCIKSNDICLILLDASATRDEIDGICNKISNAKHSLKSCILVSISESKRTKIKNVPMINLKPNDPQSITNMFAFAVKYHWFCSANN